MATNFKQTAHDILVDLVNASNAATGLELHPSAITFDNVTAAGGTLEATVVTVSATTGSGYRGSVEVTYNRVNMSFMDALAPGLVIETDATNIRDLAGYLNDMFGIQLEAADLADTLVPELQPYANTPVVFAAEGASKIFVGQVTLQLTMAPIELASMVLVTTLDGLYAPAELPAEA